MESSKIIQMVLRFTCILAIIDYQTMLKFYLFLASADVLLMFLFSKLLCMHAAHASTQYKNIPLVAVVPFILTSSLHIF